MGDVNLTTYFRGIAHNLQCPESECKEDHDSTAELKEHLWGHRAEEAGVHSIDKANRRGKCPHPSCEGRVFHANSTHTHFLTHTGGEPFVCPHLTAWTPGHRVLCGFTTNRRAALTRHRHTAHLYKEALQTANHPWVDEGNITLSAAELHFGNPRVEAHQGGNGAQEVKDENHQLDHLPPVQPPAPVLAPAYAQGPFAAGNGVNHQVQVPGLAPPHYPLPGPAVHPLPPPIPQPGQRMMGVYETVPCYNIVGTGRYKYVPYPIGAYVEQTRAEEAGTVTILRTAHNGPAL
ncbi:hypothetical protein QCA50_017472 [Cerrena zonata]|uniref:C2H2-type domain-containing protein n=1 Tax=Cerrena zonata TaxID=2478898 RepID=A0AAW0FCZ8_9APHY